jgi:hypothetical protein
MTFFALFEMIEKTPFLYTDSETVQTKPKNRSQKLRRSPPVQAMKPVVVETREYLFCKITLTFVHPVIQSPHGYLRFNEPYHTYNALQQESPLQYFNFSNQIS